MARALWKGAISFGLVNVPVELHSARKRSAELDLTMLDKRDLAPVGYQRVNKESGKEVPWKEIVKGYEYQEGEYVVLSPEDFRRANPEATRTIDIHAFVDLASIAPQYFEHPYYLLPEKRGAALIAQDDLMVLNALRYADELKQPSELKVPKAKVTGKELDMALRLVKDMEDEWRPEKFHDTYREDVLKRVKEKRRAA